jgi:predicted nucleic acid-binding protein
VKITTIPPDCRDSQDLPVLSTAIDGETNIIISGDDDLCADEELRRARQLYSIKLLGVNSFLECLTE